MRPDTQHEPIAALYDYWAGIRAGRGMPRPSDVDPLKIERRLLPHVILIDVVQRQPLRMRYRLVGTAVVQARRGLTPEDATGWYVDEIGSRFQPSPRDFYAEVVNGQRPVFHEGLYPAAATRAGSFARIGLPLSDDDGASVSRILAGYSQIVAPARPS